MTVRKGGVRTRLLVGILLAVGCGALVFHISRSRPENRNLLLITLDTVRGDFIGAYGCEKRSSPNLDRLAESSLLFERAYSTAPRTSPSHASILTSRHPSKHGIIFNGEDLPEPVSDDSTLLAEHLKAAGFRTGAVVSAGPLGKRLGFGRGFDDFEEIGTDFFRDADGRLKPRLDIGGEGTVVNQVAIKWLADNSDERFFYWVHYYEAHLPFSCADHVYDGLGVKKKLVTYDNASRLPTGVIRDQYRAEIFEVDGLVGGLLEALEDFGISNKTVVAIVADHGEYLHEHGQIGHQLLYDEMLHVPMMILAPRKISASRVPDVVSTIDLAPTLLDLLGASPLETAQGRNLLADSSVAGGHPVFAEWRAHEPFLGKAEPKPSDVLMSVQDGDLKLIQDVLFPESSELYDISVDPEEGTNLIDEPDRAGDRARMEALMKEHQKRDLDLDPAEIRELKLDDEVMESLKALGYFR